MKNTSVALALLFATFSGNKLIAQNLNRTSSTETILASANPEEATRLTTKLLGSKLPDCEFETIDGKKVNAETMAGKTIIMNFWCFNDEQCSMETPQLNQLAQQYKNDPNVIFLVFAANDKKLLANTKLDCGIISGATSYAEILGIYSYPTQLIVNSKGIITKVVIGNDEASVKTMLANTGGKGLN